MAFFCKNDLKICEKTAYSIKIAISVRDSVKYPVTFRNNAAKVSRYSFFQIVTSKFDHENFRKTTAKKSRKCLDKLAYIIFVSYKGR